LDLDTGAVMGQLEPRHAPSGRFVGGMRWRGSNASWPLAEMVVDRQGLTVQLRWRALRRLISKWLPSKRFLWGQIRAVERVRGAIPFPLNLGLTIVTEEPASHRLVFWCRSATRAKIVEIIESMGVPIGDAGRVW
jgi:hypothetical protein